MMNIYEYMFCRFYEWALEKASDRDPRIMAILILSLLIFFNVFTFGIILDIFGFMNLQNVTKTQTLIVGFTIPVLCYFLFVYKNKYKVIVNKFKNEPQKQKETHGRVMLLYIIASIVVFCFLAYIDKIIIHHLKIS